MAARKLRPMNAITVSVDFSDFLGQTLPHNRRHFDRFVVVTNLTDDATVDVATKWNCQVFRTDAFTRDGTWFNKGLALEEGFDVLGREGWIVVMDADTVLPQDGIASSLSPGNLYSPRRRLWRNDTWDGSWDWSCLPVFPDKEFAGYCQIFHVSDPILTTRPWYSGEWINGCADSDFQAKWPPNKKIRPRFEVLHIGRQAGKYRFGRSREAQLMTRKYNAMRRPGDNYINEKIKGGR